MKKILNFVLYMALCLGCATITGCSKDDFPADTPTTPNQPGNSGSDNTDSDKEPENPVSQLIGTWSQPSTDFGISSNVTSTSSIELDSSGSMKVSWSEKDNDTPYATATGTFTVQDKTLKIQWSNVTTEGVQNPVFNSFYISGEYAVSGNTLTYNYSVYDSANTKLSGPHSTSFTK